MRNRSEPFGFDDRPEQTASSGQGAGQAASALQGSTPDAGQMTTISFDVVGTPAPQGSKSRMPNGAILEGRSTAQRQGHAHWRSAVAAAARDAADEVLTGPLWLTVNFRFAMPMSRKKATRERGICPKVSAPDLDKLIRSTGDALKEGGLIGDDALFWMISARKYEVTGWTGAEIIVRQIEDVSAIA